MTAARGREWLARVRAGELLVFDGGYGTMLFAAGLITGEALIGIALAIPIAASGNPDVLALDAGWPAWVGIAVVAGIAALLYRVALRR